MAANKSKNKLRPPKVADKELSRIVNNIYDELNKVSSGASQGPTSQSIRFTSINQSQLPQNPNFNNVSLDTLQFDTSYVSTELEPQGTLYWNQDEETLSLVTNGETIELGQKVEIHVKNQTGAQINKGEVVYASGTVGASGRILVTKMIADGTIAAKRILGVAAENIANGADGKVIKFGKLRQINTSTFSDGDILWVSTTVAGGFQNSEPVQADGEIALPIAYVVYSSASVGEIFVRVTPIDENEYTNYSDYVELRSDVIENHLEIESLQDNKVEKGRKVNTGDGLSGGGALTSDLTISLGTPSTTTVGGSNAVTTDSHTHALDLSGRSITINNDSLTNPVISFDYNEQDLGDNRTWNPTIADHSSGQRGVLNDGTSAQTIYGDKTFNGALTADDSILLDNTAKFESEAGYVSGFTGSGFNLSRVSSLWRLELDDMYIRGALFASEFIVNQISAVNGSDILSPGRGKIEAFIDDTQYNEEITVSDPQGGNFASFAVNDIVIVQQVRPNDNQIVKRIVRRVSAVSGADITLVEIPVPDAPADSGSMEIGDIIVSIGNTTNADRQANIFRTVTDSDSPYVRVNDGIASWADWTGIDKLKLQYGNLDSLTSTYSNVSGYGLFSENTYLTNEILVGDLSKSANYLEYNITDGLVIKVGDDDLSTAIADIRSDLINIYLGKESAFSNINFLAGQLTLKVGADGKVASARLDATGDESAITLRADFFDFQSNDIVLIGDPNQDAGTEAKIALGSNVDTITVTNTDSGFIATGAGTFKAYADDNNYIRLQSGSLGINAELFNLTTNDIELSNNLSKQNSDITSSVTYSDTLQFAGLFFDSDNYLGHITDVDTSANSGYLFRVGGNTSNFIEVNEAGGIAKIVFDTFDLDSSDLVINSSDSSITLSSSGFLEDSNNNYRLNADGLKINTFGLSSKGGISIVGSIAFGRYGAGYGLFDYGSYIGSYNNGGTISKQDNTLYLYGTRAIHLDSEQGIIILDNLPTSSSGLPAGAIYNDSGTLKIA